MALNELNETTALSWWDLDVGDLPKALEERAKLVLGDVARKAADKNSGVVWVSELIHWLRSTIVAHWWSAHGVHARSHVSSHSDTWHATAHSTSWATSDGLVLRSCGGDTHWTVATVNTLHLGECTLLVALVGETNESIATGHAGDWVGHNLGGLAGWEARLEEANEDVLVDLWAKVADEDGVLWTAIVATISKTSTGSPVKLEWAAGVWDHSAVERECFGCSFWRGKINEAVAGVARKLVADHLDVNLLAHTEPHTAHEVLIDPWLELTHPEGSLGVGSASWVALSWLHSTLTLEWLLSLSSLWSLRDWHALHWLSLLLLRLLGKAIVRCLVEVGLGWALLKGWEVRHPCGETVDVEESQRLKEQDAEGKLTADAVNAGHRFPEFACFAEEKLQSLERQ